MRFVWRPPGLGLGIILILFKGVFKSNQIFPQWQWRGWFQLKTTGCSLLASKKCQECTVIASVSGDIAPASCSRQQNFHNIQRWWCRQVCQFQVDSLCLKACLRLAQCLNSTGWKGPSANIVKSFSKFRWHIYYPNDKAGYWLAAVSRLIWLHPPCRCLQTARTCVPAADQTLWRSGAPCYHPTFPTITEKALLETMERRWEIGTLTQRS